MQNITITGWCPKGRRSEDGSIDKKYPLFETITNEYNQRTEMNVKDAEAPLILLLNKNKDKGTEYTIKMTYEYNKHLNIINLDMNDMNDNIENAVGWIITNLIRHLNVARPREKLAEQFRKWKVGIEDVNQFEKAEKEKIKALVAKGLDPNEKIKNLPTIKFPDIIAQKNSQKILNASSETEQMKDLSLNFIKNRSFFAIKKDMNFEIKIDETI
ncbi:29057_t:CDS:2 [Gigaspora margarita]|uniref:29057_t:CDS:1 n=1 Tax=Gigaspora margarita TaxID=4874 RepID=A0ABM8VVT6_GIGMA|nr:29057_t:CDS:2 [Gigaspora margarita]